VFDELLAAYQQLEPPGSDTWNPLNHEIELWHRVRLYLELREALRLISKPLETARVLDVGCGTGRSTRALLEFGVRPENVLAIDLRSSAIEYARGLNPAVSYRTISDFNSWPAEQFDLCIQCTVFSSVHGLEARSALAQKMVASVAAGGYVYWWDMLAANDFAGGDQLNPASLFAALSVVFARQVSLQPTIAEAIRSDLRRRFRGLFFLQDRVGFPLTHLSALFQRPES
jgi:SAM-dependent methyltransferase